MSGADDDLRREPPEREDVQRLMARWGKLPVPVAPSAVAVERRERGLVTLRAAIGSAGRERQTRRMRIAGAAVAALALAISGGFELFAPALGIGTPDQREASQLQAPSELAGRALVRGPGEISTLRGGWRPVEAGHRIGEGDRVRALGHSVDVRLGRITSARVAPGSVLAIATLQAHLQELRLESGAADFEVDPKRAAEVVVHATNARIRVTGTAFSVTSGDASSEGRSEVQVKRGKVEIFSDGETFVVRAGQSWSSRRIDSGAGDVRSGDVRSGDVRSGDAGSDGVRSGRRSAGRVRQGAFGQGALGQDGSEQDRSEQATSALPAAKGPSRATVGGEPGESRGTTLAAADAGDLDGLPTTLSEENRLFRAALSARNAGSAGRCVALLSELLTKFPSSPLRQEAMVAHFRCSRDAGDARRAQRSAGRYLSEYPSGFARDEARALVLDSEP